ncbi:hypothetical protein GCM10022198_06910 [Klugiella xanthotipulae]|uniref:DNA mimic protein DMP19 C-terminal domain-containing protein n=1 Tax=Klugiella xanthotipulae TaxID=244735 RepID=A0A543HTF2_9MICO|nr:hypothetical protein [Klugiella xanthotipulae]TQM61544.1 hypothetical protein FB466_2500 [Klugiella xanthotipulae]
MSLSPESIVVSHQSLSEGDAALVASLLTTVNTLMQAGRTPGDIPGDALHGYYVDYYRAEMVSAGSIEFLHRAGRHPAVAEVVQNGLVAMSADSHAELCARIVTRWNELPLKAQRAVLRQPVFGANPARNEFRAFDEEFVALSAELDLIEANARWLRSHPFLVPLKAAELAEYLRG